MRAAYNGHAEVVNTLVAAGADKEKQGMVSKPLKLLFVLFVACVFR